MNIIKKIAVRKFIKEASKGIAKVKFQKWDMQCDVDDETVYVGRVYDKRTNEYYMNFIKEIKPECANFNVFLLSILHEIGHIMTWDEDNADNKDIIYALLQHKYDHDPDNAEEYNRAYFNIPLEYEATMWGLEWAIAHQEVMEKYAWLGEY